MNIAKNYLYNVIYQVFILIVPLITIPYISRVLGSRGIGINAYTNSIIQYFILFGTIGVALYGTRAIAYVRDNKENLSRTFWSIYCLKLITTSVSYLLFIIFLKIVHQYDTIFMIQSIFIISAAIDISWLYMGLEDFKKTVVRNLIVKIIGVISIFIFVKTSTDIWKYVLILSCSELFGQLTLWMYLPKTVNKIKLVWHDIANHMKPALALFIPQIAIQIYIVLNKTMLGIFSNVSEVGYFDNADKIVKVILAVVTAMGVVMLPRISNTFAKGETEKVKEYLYKSFGFASYLSIPMMFGLAAIAESFTPWFFGPAFTKTGLLIVIISPIIVFIAWSNVLGVQYLMPIGNVRSYTISVICGAIANFILNLVLIPTFQSVGTAFATLAAELSVTIVQLAFIIKKTSFKKLFNDVWKYIIAGLLMYLVTRLIGLFLPGRMLTTLIQIVVAAPLYFLTLNVLKSEMNRQTFIRMRKLIKKSE